jgi:cobalt-zinc-cadmium efflux system protein
VPFSHRIVAPPERSRQRRVLHLVLVVQCGLLVALVVSGTVFGSLALLAEAAHQFSDVAGIGFAVLALRLVDRPASGRHSYGFQRAEVLAALANGLLLLGASVWVFVEAARRLARPEPVDGLGLLVVASASLMVNLGSAWLLTLAERRSLGMRSVFVHLASDAAGSLGAVGAGVAVLVWGTPRADPAISIGIGFMVVWAAWRLLRETAHVLVEGTPRGLDPVEVERFLASREGVEGVHHLHLWSIASDVPVLSAHVVLEGEPSLRTAQSRAEQIRRELAKRFAITFATLELEAEACEPSDEEAGSSP